MVPSGQESFEPHGGGDGLSRIAPDHREQQGLIYDGCRPAQGRVAHCVLSNGTHSTNSILEPYYYNIVRMYCMYMRILRCFCISLVALVAPIQLGFIQGVPRLQHGV